MKKDLDLKRINAPVDIIHTVKKGEKIEDIVQRYSIDIKDLINYNQLLIPGNEIRIPCYQIFLNKNSTRK